MPVAVEVDINSVRQYTKDASEYVQRLYSGRKRQIIDAYGKLVDPWVPYKSGQLSDYKIDVENGLLIYSATSEKGFDYADTQYYSDDSAWNRNRAVHPLATSNWVEVAHPIIYDDFIKQVQDIMRR